MICNKKLSLSERHSSLQWWHITVTFCPGRKFDKLYKIVFSSILIKFCVEKLFVASVVEIEPRVMATYHV